MVGSSLFRLLSKDSDNHIIVKSRSELDLTCRSDVQDFFNNNKIDQVYLAAAKVGGIIANSENPANFLFENLMIQMNIIESAHINNVQDMLFLGSSCIYPRLAVQPMTEDALLSGHLEPTNEGYAIAKIAGIKLCETYNKQYGRNYRSIMPSNLYGPGDNFHPEHSHVIPGLMRRFHEAKIENKKEVLVWGTGNAKREFTYVDDIAQACLFVANLPPEEYNSSTSPNLSHINAGCGIDYSIKELANTIARVVGFKGLIDFDSSKPDGAPRKLVDVNLINNLGWKSSVELEEGLGMTYEWFIENSTSYRS